MKKNFNLKKINKEQIDKPQKPKIGWEKKNNFF